MGLAVALRQPHATRRPVPACSRYSAAFRPLRLASTTDCAAGGRPEGNLPAPPAADLGTATTTGRPPPPGRHPGASTEATGLVGAAGALSSAPPPAAAHRRVVATTAGACRRPRDDHLARSQGHTTPPGAWPAGPPGDVPGRSGPARDGLRADAGGNVAWRRAGDGVHCRGRGPPPGPRGGRGPWAGGGGAGAGRSTGLCRGERVLLPNARWARGPGRGATWGGTGAGRLGFGRRKWPVPRTPAGAAEEAAGAGGLRRAAAGAARTGFCRRGAAGGGLWARGLRARGPWRRGSTHRSLRAGAATCGLGRRRWGGTPGWHRCLRASAGGAGFRAAPTPHAARRANGRLERSTMLDFKRIRPVRSVGRALPCWVTPSSFRQHRVTRAPYPATTNSCLSRRRQAGRPRLRVFFSYDAWSSRTSRCGSCSSAACSVGPGWTESSQ